MSNPHLYRRFNLLRLGRIPPPKPVGGFVVGVPTKDVRTFQTENPAVAIDGVFLKLVSAEDDPILQADLFQAAHCAQINEKYARRFLHVLISQKLVRVEKIRRESANRLSGTFKASKRREKRRLVTGREFEHSLAGVEPMHVGDRVA